MSRLAKSNTGRQLASCLRRVLSDLALAGAQRQRTHSNRIISRFCVSSGPPPPTAVQQLLRASALCYETKRNISPSAVKNGEGGGGHGDEPTARKRARICLSSGDRRADLNDHSGGISTSAVDSQEVVKWIRGERIEDLL
ncbi:unnamed protein product [Arctogadus glacialis]